MLLMTAFVGCFTTTAQAQGETNLYQLKNGDLTMSIDINKGGKILSLKHKDIETIPQSRFPESFGSTFWTSPQKEWNWPPVPEYDKNPYTVVEQSDKKLVIKSQVSERMKYQIGKTFTTDAKSGAYVITYTIKNEADETRKVAPWEITRVTNADGIIFFDAPLEGITPAGLMNFTARRTARSMPTVTDGWPIATTACCSSSALKTSQPRLPPPARPRFRSMSIAVRAISSWRARVPTLHWPLVRNLAGRYAGTWCPSRTKHSLQPVS